MSEIMKTTIKQVGEHSNKFLDEGLLLLFSHQDIMSEVKTYSILVEEIIFSGNISQGQTLHIDDSTYEITAVGSIAEENLRNIAHVTFRANSNTEAELPGTIYIEEKPYPELKEGSKILITDE